jgi:nicotinamidase-related amidase
MSETKTALIVIDMINTYAHKDADLLIPSVRDALPRSYVFFSGPGSGTCR